MTVPTKVDTYRLGSQLHTFTVCLHPPLAQFALLRSLHHLLLSRSHTVIVAGDVILLECHIPDKDPHPSFHVLCTLTLPIIISDWRTVIAAKQLSDNDQDYFAVSLGFDSTDAYRTFYLDHSSSFAGRLVCFT